MPVLFIKNQYYIYYTNKYLLHSEAGVLPSAYSKKHTILKSIITQLLSVWTVFFVRIKENPCVTITLNGTGEEIHPYNTKNKPFEHHLKKNH